MKTMNGSIDKLKANAERDESGDLVHTKEVTHKQGHTITKETNLSALFNPGKRTTGDVNILLHEARQAVSERPGPDNPAFPASAEATNEAVPRIKEEGLEPAWKDHEPEDYL